MKSLDRRTLLAALGTALGATRLRAQEASPGQMQMRNMPGMDQDAYRPVRLPPKPNARPQLTNDQRDALEHHLHCQCGCGLDVYTCRTTDFTCQVSPAMHFDVMGLVSGGYGADEIIAVFRKVYGPRVLMEPPREGWNLLAYFLPFGALVAGGALVVTLLKRWTRSEAHPTAAYHAPDATPEEMERLRRALRSDE